MRERYAQLVPRPWLVLKGLVLIEGGAYIIARYHEGVRPNSICPEPYKLERFGIQGLGNIFGECFIEKDFHR